MFDLMNTRIGDLLNKATRITFADVWKEVFRDEQFKTEILDWIRWDQLYNEGVDEFGQIIGTYSRATEMFNPEKLEGTPFTLYDTGEFYNSMMIEVFDDYIEINGDGLKVDEFGQTTDLFQEYGYEIIGLTDESKEKLAQELIDRFNYEYKQLLSIN
jgi:hypothetical protein